MSLDSAKLRLYDLLIAEDNLSADAVSLVIEDIVTEAVSRATSAAKVGKEADRKLKAERLFNRIRARLKKSDDVEALAAIYFLTLGEFPSWSHLWGEVSEEPETSAD